MLTMAFVPVRFDRPQVLPPVLCSRRLYIHIMLLIITILVLVLVRFLSQIQSTFIHYHMESDTDAELVTLPASFVSERGAFCLDGSPPAYYLKPSPLSSVKYWIVYLPDGEWCVSEEDCSKRSLTALGSSHLAPTSLSLDGFLSKNCNTNPDFCLWNVLIFHYCDGASFLGNRSRSITFNARPLYMRGARVFDALLEYLMEATDLRGAEQIVLAGSSSGGVGALIHVDRLRSKLPQSVKTLHALVDSAMFVDTVDINGEHTMATILRSTYHLHSLKDTKSIQECTQVIGKNQEWKCLFPEVYLTYVFTPVFFVNSVYDSWQRTTVLKIPCFAVTCPEAYKDVVYKARDTIKALAVLALLSKKNGVFLTFCPVHTILVRPYFHRTELGNLTLQKSLSQWMQHSKTLSNVNVEIFIEAAVEACQLK